MAVPCSWVHAQKVALLVLWLSGHVAGLPLQFGRDLYFGVHQYIDPHIVATNDLNRVNSSYRPSPGSEAPMEELAAVKMGLVTLAQDFPHLFRRYNHSLDLVIRDTAVS